RPRRGCAPAQAPLSGSNPIHPRHTLLGSQPTFAMMILIVHQSVTRFETKHPLPIRFRLIVVALLVLLGVVFSGTVAQAQDGQAQDDQACSKGEASCEAVDPQDAGSEDMGAEDTTSELTAPPPSVEAQLSTGDRERARAEWTGAEEAYLAAIGVSPVDARAYVRLRELYQHQGRLQEALVILQEA